MKLRVLIWLFLILSLAFFTQVNAQSGAAKGKGRVKGTVTDTEGKPLEGVTVRFHSTRLNTSFEAKTDAKGNWIVSGMSGGAWDVDFILEGYKDRRISTQLSELAYNKPIDLQMEKRAAAPPPKEKTPGLDLVEEANKLRDAKDYPGAIAKYEAALQANPALFAVYGDIARIYNEMGNTDKAIESFNKFLEKDPTNAEAKIELANLLLSKSRVDDAKKILTDVDLSTITNPYTIYNLGVGMYNAQQAEEAIKYWEKTVALDPKMTDAYLQMGFAYYSIKNIDKAREAFQKVVEIEPGSDNAKSAQEMLDTIKQ